MRLKISLINGDTFFVEEGMYLNDNLFDGTLYISDIEELFEKTYLSVAKECESPDLLEDSHLTPCKVIPTRHIVSIESLDKKSAKISL